MAGVNNHEIWSPCIEANYLASARPAGRKDGEKCPTCNSPKDCNNYYCLLCKVGGLCPITFRTTGPNSDPGEHHRHPWLQVRNYSHKPAVLEADLERFIGPESTKYIQKYKLNQGGHCFLRSRKPQEPSSNDASPSNSKAAKNKLSDSSISETKKCWGCRSAIPKSEGSTIEFLVCSLQCLMVVAEREPGQRSLLQMRVDGAMDLTEPPLLAPEKFGQTRPDEVPDEVVPPNNNSDGGIQGPPARRGRRGGRRAACDRPGYQIGGFNFLITEIKSLGDWDRTRSSTTGTVRRNRRRDRMSTATMQSPPQN